MATKFLEPGGDSDFLVGTTNGFWGSLTNTPTVATDFVHGGHIKSIKYGNNLTSAETATGALADAGSRISFYIYIVARPSVAKQTFARLLTSGSVSCVRIYMTSAGVIQLWNTGTAQIGTDGATLSTGQWYRISLAYTITNGTTNRFELFVDGVSSISITNATITNVATSIFSLGTISLSDAAFDLRTSDHYIDNSSSLTDTGNIWVTAKRPNTNGTTNGFTTQIGAGGSGYGSGHSPQVNERALSTTNGWSMVGAGSAVTEEYNVEAKNVGDIDISTATIVDWLGWASMKSLVGETVQMILNGSTSTQAITSTATLYTKIAGSTTYPAGTGADIGITTDTSLTTVSLYECGVIVAYIPAAAGAATVTPTPTLAFLGVG
jgi:hypothetical protein